ncbi:MAG TPA: hypothetical protein VG816_11475 [Solirubrobacterales bacterium]|nr:hypothetical protein [Solirubrobacterales bacterium]
MTRLGAISQTLRQARSRLTASWRSAESGWKDKRAREFEARYQAPLDSATLGFEQALARLDEELRRIERDLPLG